MNAELANTILGFLTLLTQIVAVILLVTAWKFPGSRLAQFVSRHVLWIVFLTALAGMVASLFYSEILHYTPCVLCWYQRIFLYPLAFIFGLAIIKKDRSILPYGLLLAIPGGLIGLYHHFVQFSLVPSIPCGAQAVSCSVRFVLEFGYITFPLMSFTAFAVIVLSLIIAKRAPVSEMQH